jgi:serine/threonine protein kinase
LSSEFINNEHEDNLVPGKILLHTGQYFSVFKVRIGIKWYVRKQLNTSFKDSPLYRGILSKEFEIGQQLEHHNLVKYLNYGTDEEGEFILTEFIDGETLSALIADNNITNGQSLIALFIRDLLPAVKYLHSKGIVHGDISLNNIIYDQSANKLYLIDYGHTKSRSFVNLSGGTNNFISPEAANTPALVNQSSDVFSIGKVLEKITSECSVKGYDELISRCCFENQSHRLQTIESVERYLLRSKRKVLFAALSFALLLTIDIATFYFRRSTTVVSNSKSSVAIPADSLPKNAFVSSTNEKPIRTNNKIEKPLHESSKKTGEKISIKLPAAGTVISNNMQANVPAIKEIKPTTIEQYNKGHFVVFKSHHTGRSLNDQTYDIVTRPIEVSSILEFQQADTFYALLQRIFRGTRFNVDEIGFGNSSSSADRRSITFREDKITIGPDCTTQVVLPVYYNRSDAMKEFYHTVHESYGKQIMVIDIVK